MKLGLFTVSVPDWEPVETLRNLARAGYQGVEWRVCEDRGDRRQPGFWSGNRCSLTARELKERAGDLKAVAREYGLEMAGVAAYIDCKDAATVALHLEAAAAVGAAVVRIGAGGYAAQSTYSEQLVVARRQYAEVARLAADHGVRACVETHMGTLTPNILSSLQVLDGLEPKHVGILWDPGNEIIEGSETTRMALELAGPYLAEVHVKNNAWERVRDEKTGALRWRCSACPIPDGVADWPAIVQELKKSGYAGWLVVEDFSTVLPLAERVAANAAYLRKLL